MAPSSARISAFHQSRGGSGAAGAYFTWRQVQNSTRTLEHTREQLEVARQGQVTERFTRAIDQLGSDQLDIRLGGIYALERIARDSGADQPTIAEILTAYVRQHSPWPPTQPGQYRADWPLERQPDLRTRAPDVQAALMVLGRGRFANLTVGSARLDLQAADLRKADLARANLERAILRDTHLEESNLRGAHLEWVDLRDTQLEGVDLTRAHLKGADLTGATLTGARLEEADLSYVSLTGAHLKGSDLSYALLNKANLTDVRLKGSVIRRTARWPDGFDWRAAGVVLVDQFGKPVVEPDGTSAGAEADMPAPAVSDGPAAGLP